MRGSVWLLIAGFLVFFEAAAFVAMGGRVEGSSDLAFYGGATTLAVAALINAIRLQGKAG